MIETVGADTCRTMCYSLAHPAYTPHQPPGSHQRRNKPNMQVAVCIKNGIAIPDNFNNFGQKVEADASRLKATAFIKESEAMQKQVAEQAILALELFIVDFKSTKAGNGPWRASDGSRLRKEAAHEAMRHAAKRAYDSLTELEQNRYANAAQEMAARDADHDLKDEIKAVMQKSTLT